MAKQRGYVDPSILKPFLSKKENEILAVIETPKGSRNKFAWDKDMGTFRLSKVLPSGMQFPYDFGFVPSTVCEDGDPLDLLIFMDEPAFCGCVIEVRLIGVLEGEQTEDGKTERNDRLIAVAKECHEHSDVKSMKDMNPHLLKELEQFFKNYHSTDDTTFKVVGHGGPGEAMKLAKKAYKAKK